MAVSQINSVVHLCEDTSKQFDLIDLLVAAGYTATLPISITQMYVLNAAGLPDTSAPAGLFTQVDADTVKVDATVYPDRNFTFNTLTIVLDAGPNQVIVNIQVIVDPVNDAPTAEDHTITLASGAGYVIKETDFGFADPHDANPANQANPAGNNFASVVITGLPPSGSLLLNGVAVAFGAEISIAEIRAGHLVYQPGASASGQAAFGFEVRDDGGTAGCGGNDLSIVHHMVFNIPTASLGDRVWYDTNGNGLQDTGEAGVAGVTVNLLNPTGQVIATQTTDASGHYLFTLLPPGQYAVQVVSPTGYKFTTANAGVNDAIDSDVVWNGTGTSTGTSGLVTLSAGETNLSVDAGIKVCLVNVGDRVWNDTNGNGIQDAGETGVAGVAVQLKGAGIDGQFGTADDFSRTTTTDANGNYLFSNVAWGQYKLAMTLPYGMALTSANVGSNDATDSDLQTVTGTAGPELITNGGFENWATGWTGLGDTVEVGPASLYGVTGATGIRVLELDSLTAGSGTGVYQDVSTAAGQIYQLSLDVAARANTSLATNTVEVWWGDARIATIDPTSTTFSTYKFNVVGTGGLDRLSFREQAGDDDSLGGIIDNVHLNATATSSNTTGVYTVASCDDNLTIDGGLVNAKTASLGDRVWVDTNHNGLQDSGEAGLSGVSVTLAGAGADGLFGTSDDITRSTTTDSAGNYLFSGLAAGNYQVTFGGKTGYQFTTANAGNDSIDSDANASTGKSQVVTLANGESNRTVDAGLVKCDPKTGAIGDRVWQDDAANGSGLGHANGIQDSGDTYGIGGVRVYLYESATSSGGGTLVASTVTDSSGHYRFDNLEAGWYQVEFDKQGLKNTTPLGTGAALDTWSWSPKDQGTDDSKDSDVTAGNIAKTRTDVFFLNEGQVDLSRDAGLTPIVIDLNGDGIHTIARGASDATFDLLGNGSAIHSGWISGQDGFLAVDRNGNGKIDDINELFGGTTKGAGFAKLSSFDSNGDGVVDSHDAHFDQLRIWQDINGNHQTDAGELVTLAQAGVAALTVAHTDQPALDAQGNLHLERSNASMANGSSVDMTDVYFNVDAADAAAAGAKLPTMGELLGVDNALLDHVLGSGVAHALPVAAAPLADESAALMRQVIAAMKYADLHTAVVA